MAAWQAVLATALILLVVALSLQGRSPVEHYAPISARVQNDTFADIQPNWDRANEVLFFSHVPRTGGGTFSSIVGAVIGRDRCHPQSHEGRSILRWRDFLTEGGAWCDKWRAIYAHEDFSLLRHIPCRARALVFIRDPIQHRRSMWDKPYQAAKMFDPYFMRHRVFPGYDDYIGSDLYPTMYQVEWIAGATTLWPRSKAPGRYVQRLHEDTSLLLEYAKRNLLDTVWFGITERYNESLCLFFGTHQLVPPPYNQWGLLHPSKGESVKPSPEQIKRQRKLLSFEYEFYEWAVALFAQRWSLFVRRYKESPAFYAPFIAPECDGYLPIQSLT